MQKNVPQTGLVTLRLRRGTRGLPASQPSLKVTRRPYFCIECLDRAQNDYRPTLPVWTQAEAHGVGQQEEQRRREGVGPPPAPGPGGPALSASCLLPESEVTACVTGMGVVGGGAGDLARPSDLRQGGVATAPLVCRRVLSSCAEGDLLLQPHTSAQLGLRACLSDCSALSGLFAEGTARHIPQPGVGCVQGLHEGEQARGQQAALAFTSLRSASLGKRMPGTG